MIGWRFNPARPESALITAGDRGERGVSRVNCRHCCAAQDLIGDRSDDEARDQDVERAAKPRASLPSRQRQRAALGNKRRQRTQRQWPAPQVVRQERPGPRGRNCLDRTELGGRRQVARPWPWAGRRLEHRDRAFALHVLQAPLEPRKLNVCSGFVAVKLGRDAAVTEAVRRQRNLRASVERTERSANRGHHGRPPDGRTSAPTFSPWFAPPPKKSSKTYCIAEAQINRQSAALS